MYSTTATTPNMIVMFPGKYTPEARVLINNLSGCNIKSKTPSLASDGGSSTLFSIAPLKIAKDKTPRIKRDQRSIVLSTNLRHGEREPMSTIPPEARKGVAYVQPGTTFATVRVQQGRIVVEILDWFVHGDDPQEIHGFDLLVRELLTDKAGQFGIRLRELALVGFDADFLGAPAFVLEEHALENSNFGRHAIGRLEIRRTEYVLGAITHVETLTIQALDPVLASCAVGGDREADDAIFLVPRTGRFGNREFVAEKTKRHVVAAELLNDGVKLAGGEASGCEFCAHDCISLG